MLDALSMLAGQCWRDLPEHNMARGERTSRECVRTLKRICKDSYRAAGRLRLGSVEFTYLWRSIVKPAAAVQYNSVLPLAVAQSRRVTLAGTVLARYALIVVLVLIGLSKFTAGEAAGIMPLISHSPFPAWTYAIASTQQVSDTIGLVELLIAVLLFVRPFVPFATAAGAVLSTLTFVTTLSFLLTTPGALAFNGLAVLGDVGAFLIKDLALLAASLIVLGEALSALGARRPTSALV